MLLSAVSVLVVAQSSSEIPEGLMNNTVFEMTLLIQSDHFSSSVFCYQFFLILVFYNTFSSVLQCIPKYTLNTADLFTVYNPPSYNGIIYLAGCLYKPVFPTSQFFYLPNAGKYFLISTSILITYVFLSILLLTH